jgi:hypothetical protein
MNEIQLLSRKVDEQRDKIISQGAQIERMNKRQQFSNEKIQELLESIEVKNRVLKRLKK